MWGGTPHDDDGRVRPTTHHHTTTNPSVAANTTNHHQKTRSEEWTEQQGRSREEEHARADTPHSKPNNGRLQNIIPRTSLVKNGGQAIFSEQQKEKEGCSQEPMRTVRCHWNQENGGLQGWTRAPCLRHALKAGWHISSTGASPIVCQVYRKWRPEIRKL